MKGWLQVQILSIYHLPSFFPPCFIVSTGTTRGLRRAIVTAPGTRRGTAGTLRAATTPPNCFLTLAISPPPRSPFPPFVATGPGTLDLSRLNPAGFFVPGIHIFSHTFFGMRAPARLALLSEIATL